MLSPSVHTGHGLFNRHLPVDVRRVDRQEIPARPVADDSRSFAEAVRVDRFHDLAAAVAAAEHDFQSPLSGRALVARAPPNPESAGVARERFGLTIAAARPCADAPPRDPRLL